MRLLPGLRSTFVARVAGLLLAFVVNVTVIRSLATDDAGRMFMFLGLAVLFTHLVQAGVQRTAVQEVATAEASGTRPTGPVVRAIVSVSLLSMGLLAALASPVGAWATGGLEQELEHLRVQLAVFVGIRALVLLAAELHRAFDRHILAALITNIHSSALAASLLLGARWISGGALELQLAIWLIIAAWIPDLVLALALVFRDIDFRRLGRRSSLNVIGGSVVMIRSSWRIMFVGLAMYTVAQADVIIVGAWLGPAQAAQYGAALRMVTLLGIPLATMASALGPHIARHVIRPDRTLLERELRSTTTMALSLTILGASLGALVGQEALRALYGRQYEGAYSILMILAIGQVASVWAGPCNLVMTMAREDRTQLRLLLLNIAILSGMLAALYAVGPSVHSVAAAFAIGLVLQNVFPALYLREQLALRTYAWAPWRLREGLRGRTGQEGLD